MHLHILKPKKALNKAYLKIKPIRSEIEEFKGNLIDLLDNSNDTESEEFHKNLVSDFLKNTYYERDYFINTKGRNDLVIHNGGKAKSPVGVILETKKPTNYSEMMTAEKPNTKALQELVLYYLRERITSNNLEVKKLIVTNIYEWFIFDASFFEKYFAQNKTLVKQFEDFENGSLSGTSTDFFYKEIAKPAIEAIQEEVECTYFDFRQYEKPLRNTDKKDDVKLVALFKLLSPEHLLKKPFTNDSNSLDKRFYAELLHIIGLSEQKQGGKKVIERNPSKDRNTGSILEDAIIQIDSMDKLSRLNKPSQFGKTQEERLFNVGLELSITWINRILFLKLLEAQLIAYHEGDKSYAFLNYQRISSYDDLNSLFFQVLARKYEDRNADVTKAFEKVPYLNSSLFEPTEIEHNALFISNLRDDKTLPILHNTVLKDAKGKRRTGELSTLAYLFDFLNAYDFSGEGSENIQEDNKTLINASVLGLIFEKINGYKDGSFFTPGFITMYMCRETIRKAVVQKFNETEVENEKYNSITDIYNAIGSRGEFSHDQANALINDIKICDPAVGSGHFLVSALNEMIAVKHDLGVLHDRQGKLLRDYDVHVENDELIITDYNGELFEYHPKNRESQRVQETLFHEKQSIIENCLFGVDINANSVKICRLRLWIELLKNAYYKNETELETLPNIDINIKCGNSLISRFDLDADLSKALRSSKWNMDSYRIAVQTYRNAENKEQKHEMERLIADIKGDFKTEISRNSKEQRLYDKLSAELYEKHMAPKLFEEELSRSAKSKLKKDREKLEKKVTKLKEQLDEIKDNKIYENAFEWRFEFPEVLDDEGGFVGFDVVIGNPPYLLVQNLNDKPLFDYYKSAYITATYKIDTYPLFIEKGETLLKESGTLSFITPNTFLKNKHAKDLRILLLNNRLTEVINFYTKVFIDASVDTLILSFVKEKIDNNTFTYIQFRDWSLDIENHDKTKLNQNSFKINNYEFELDLQPHVRKVLTKIESSNLILKDIGKTYFGIQTKDRTKNVSGYKIDENYYPVIDGTNIKRYKVLKNTEFVNFQKHAIKSGGSELVYQNHRIVVRQIGKYPEGSIVDPMLLTLNTIYNIFLKDNNLENLKALLGIINSKVVAFYWLNKFYDNKATFPKIKKSPLDSIPIPNLDKASQVGNLVDQILTAKQEDPSADTTALEREIDVLVYRLYGLSYEEVKVVDEDFWMGEDEYERVEGQQSKVK